MQMNVENFKFLAAISEKAERYEDMLEYVKNIAETKQVLDDEEKRLFLVANKNCLHIKRQEWTKIKSMEVVEAADSGNEKYISEYRLTVESELKNLCYRLLTLLESHLIPYSNDIKSRITYLMMKGDFYRYLAEVSCGEELEEHAQASAVAYKEASEIAVDELKPTDSLRAGIALNFSVLLHDVLDMPEKAHRMAISAADAAIDHLDYLTRDEYNEITVIVDLLLGNAMNWATEIKNRQPLFST